MDLAAAADLSQDHIDVTAVLDQLVSGADASAATTIGYPGAVDVNYDAVLSRLGSRLWNNIGDPSDAGGIAHTRVLERAVVAWMADLFAMPPGDRWGYVTTGGTEGNLAALYAAGRRYATARIFYSRAAHYSIPKLVRVLGAHGVPVAADERGEMDYHDLATQLHRRKRYPAIVVATAGTTLTEAVDDTARIRDLLAAHPGGGHLHVDAALSGIPLGLDGRLRLDDAAGIGSIAVSGHKVFGTPVPCGVVLVGDTVRAPGQPVAYTGTSDTTISGSRCGLAAALLWHAIAVQGREGHRWRVVHARELATYAVARITAIGWHAWRHDHAMTVVLDTPPAEVRTRWVLATEGPVSHLICMPGITRTQIDAFVADLAAAIPRPTAPRPRTPADSIGLITTTH
ncbi:histidine decarboxylase [Micromonospora sp. WMMD980]|uniref:histidine decarboxylase n=1 Tax=Micromonospora sp. WMMD980 TaxID=3016088 RepID=UPI002416311D|nr:histidine decarboxylase [Micromonospora sp. WMMD980]MDG4803697.1 histidine decarboxylase [Micromonospora sp. WMMD980]